MSRSPRTAESPAGPPPTIPTAQLDATGTADLELVLDGVLLPWMTLGGSVNDGAGTGTRPRSGSAVASGRSPATVAVRLPTDVAAAARTANTLLLLDAENTPLARMHGILVDDSTGSAEQAVTGTVTRERRRESGHGVLDGASPVPAGAVVVVARRPPLIGELDEVRGVGGADRVAVVVPTEGTTPDGLDVLTLVEAVAAAIRSCTDPSRVSIHPMPVASRDPTSDGALFRAVGAAHRAERIVVLGEDPAWAGLVHAARRGAPLPHVVDREVTAVLAERLRDRSRGGLVVMFTGLSGSGKSTLARDLTHHIRSATTRTVTLLDGDAVRRLLSSGLGFDAESRDLNVRRIGFVATEVARHGGVAICAPIAPYESSRRAVREMVEQVADFVLVHVATPLDECERRDLKGLYARARSGELKKFTGISDPYEEPTDADLTVDTSRLSRDAALRTALDHLEAGGWLPGCRRD